MKITSKIKTLFKPQTVHDLAAVCDTRRIPSNIKKMELVMKILVRERKDVMQIGGATNRIVVQIEGYIIKVALDSQGFEDNLMEFSLAEELSGDTSKTYETNGYLLVAQLARLMTKDEWYRRKGDILRKLERLSKDYLLGDVGYDELNRTNWGVLDNDDVVILDYAYIHRATERLFTCPDCEDGTLTYDQYYTQLMCSNMTHCKSRFTYSEMKKIQGSEVDEKMIAEKLATSIVLKGDQVDHEIQLIRDGDLVDASTIVIHNNLEYERFLQEEESGRIDTPITWEELEEFQEMQMKAANSDNPDEIYMIWMQKREAAKPVKRKFVLADDYYEVSKDIIHPRWVGMEHGETHEAFQKRMNSLENNPKEEKDMLDLTRKPTQFGGGIRFTRDEEVTQAVDDVVLETEEGRFYGDPRPEPNTGKKYQDDSEDGCLFLGIRHPGKRKGKPFLGQQNVRREYVRKDDEGASYEVRRAVDLYTQECMRLSRIINNSYDEEEILNAQEELEKVKEFGYEKFLEDVKAESDGNRRNDRRDNRDNRNNNQQRQRNDRYNNDRNDRRPKNNQPRYQNDPPRQQSKQTDPQAESKSEPVTSQPAVNQEPAPEPEPSTSVPVAGPPMKEEPKAVVPEKKSKYGAILSSDDEFPVSIQQVLVNGKEV